MLMSLRKKKVQAQVNLKFFNYGKQFRAKFWYTFLSIKPALKITYVNVMPYIYDLFTGCQVFVNLRNNFFLY